VYRELLTISPVSRPPPSSGSKRQAALGSLRSQRLLQAFCLQQAFFVLFCDLLLLDVPAQAKLPPISADWLTSLSAYVRRLSILSGWQVEHAAVLSSELRDALVAHLERDRANGLAGIEQQSARLNQSQLLLKLQRR